MNVNRSCRILDKRTGANYFGMIDTEFEGLDFYHLVEISNNGKNYAFKNGMIVESVLDMPAIRQQGIDYLTKRVLEHKAVEFIIPINTADNKVINIATDLKDTTLGQWLIVKNKIPKDLKDVDGNVIATNVRYVQVLNKDTLMQEFVPLTEEEILRLNTFLTNSVDVLTCTIINLTNSILTAPDELVARVYNMTDAEKEAHILYLIEVNTPTF